MVDEIRRFRVDSYDLPTSGSKNILNCKNALSRRWVCFYHSLLNLNILQLQGIKIAPSPLFSKEPFQDRNAETDLQDRKLSLKKLILASHLSSQKDEAKTSTNVAEGDTIIVNEEDDYGAHHDNLSANSDPDGIMKVSKTNTNGLDDGEMGNS